MKYRRKIGRVQPTAPRPFFVFFSFVLPFYPTFNLATILLFLFDPKKDRLLYPHLPLFLSFSSDHSSRNYVTVRKVLLRLAERKVGGKSRQVQSALSSQRTCMVKYDSTFVRVSRKPDVTRPEIRGIRFITYLYDNSLSNGGKSVNLRNKTRERFDTWYLRFLKCNVGIGNLVKKALTFIFICNIFAYYVTFSRYSYIRSYMYIITCNSIYVSLYHCTLFNISLH